MQCLREGSRECAEAYRGGLGQVKRLEEGSAQFSIFFLSTGKRRHGSLRQSGPRLRWAIGALLLAMPEKTREIAMAGRRYPRVLE